MKAVCEREALRAALELVWAVVVDQPGPPDGTVLGIMIREQSLRNPVRLTVDEGGLALGVSGGGLSLRLRLEAAAGREPGEALIPAGKLREIVGALDGPALTLTADGDEWVVAVRSADARFWGPLDEDQAVAAEAPDWPAVGVAADRLTVDARVFARLIERTVFAAARENSRYAINGALLKRSGEKLEMVATDARRLAIARGSAEWEAATQDGSRCVIPARALRLAQRLMEGAGEPGEVMIAVTADRVFLSFEGGGPPWHSALLVTDQVSGDFPKYEDVIPEDHDKRATFDAGTLLSAVRRAAVATGHESRGVRMSFCGTIAERVVLEAHDPDTGIEADIAVPLAAYEGDDIEIGFHPTFLGEALAVLPSGEATLEMTAPNRPGVIRLGDAFLYVVMPVNIGGDDS